MVETKLNRGDYDDEELKNIARVLQVSGLSGEMKGGYFSKIDSGTSMNPTIRAGDTILWAKVENMAELKVGDIILFKSPVSSDYVVHRIVCVIEVKGKGKYLFQTKGDKHVPDNEGRRYRDRYAVPDENVLGVVIGVVYKTHWGPMKNEKTR